MTMTTLESRGASDLAEALGLITHAACALVSGAEEASVSVRHADGSLETLAATDPITVLADQVQHELHEGPCYDVVPGDDVQLAGDLAHEARWPSYGPKAAALGLHSQLAVCLHDEADTRALLNLYAIQSDALVESAEAARVLADLARAAIRHGQAYSTLVAALRSREVIGEAVGLTMERYGIDAERAFAHLVRESQTSNTKLRDLAANLVSDTDTGAAAPTS